MAWDAPRRRKLVLGTLAGLLLGVTGNGLWEWLVKPFLLLGRDFFLGLATLGLKTLKDGTYQSVAEGFHETAGMELLTAMLAFLVVVVLFRLVHLARWIKISRAPCEVESVDSEGPEGTHGRPSGGAGDASRGEVGGQDREFRRWLRTRIGLAIGMVTCMLIVATRIGQIGYVNSAVTHFEQMRRIAAPYMTEHESADALSRFARISTKEDYVAVLKTLEDIAREHKLGVPSFSPW